MGKYRGTSANFHCPTLISGSSAGGATSYATHFFPQYLFLASSAPLSAFQAQVQAAISRMLKFAQMRCKVPLPDSLLHAPLIPTTTFSSSSSSSTSSSGETSSAECLSQLGVRVCAVDRWAAFTWILRDVDALSRPVAGLASPTATADEKPNRGPCHHTGLGIAKAGSVDIAERDADPPALGEIPWYLPYGGAVVVDVTDSLLLDYVHAHSLSEGEAGGVASLRVSQSAAVRTPVPPQSLATAAVGTGEASALGAGVSVVSLGNHKSETGTGVTSSKSRGKGRQPTAAVPASPLDSCMRWFAQPESLGESWYCPHCKTHRAAVKQLDVWRAPLVLIVHLKRFRAGMRARLNTPVDFPLVWDASAHVRDSSCAAPVYELFAVCNHAGTVTKGHYTACIKANPDGSVPVQSALTVSSTKLTIQSQSQTQRQNADTGSGAPQDSCVDAEDTCMTSTDAGPSYVDPHTSPSSTSDASLSSAEMEAANPKTSSAADVWYLVDDREVSVISASDIVSPDAYVLFYKLKQDSAARWTS